MTEMKLTIDLQSFSPKNEVRKRGIATTLEWTFEAFMSVFERQPDAGVNVAWWGSPKPPRTLFDRRPYEIRLTAWGNGWPQYAYQFAHELCHVMTNFDRVKEHRHKWFEESLCELASLFVLYRLAKAWAADPPAGISAAGSYAPAHAEYARSEMGKSAPVPRSGLPGVDESQHRHDGGEQHETLSQSGCCGRTPGLFPERPRALAGLRVPEFLGCQQGPDIRGVSRLVGRDSQRSGRRAGSDAKPCEGTGSLRRVVCRVQCPVS